jgi:hypothetical protein
MDPKVALKIEIKKDYLAKQVSCVTGQNLLESLDFEKFWTYQIERCHIVEDSNYLGRNFVTYLIEFLSLFVG